MLVAQLCQTLCDPKECSAPDSSCPQNLQASIQQWVLPKSDIYLLGSARDVR